MQTQGLVVDTFAVINHYGSRTLARSAIVWQDHTQPEGSPRRWVMSSVPKDNGFKHCRIRISPDGLNWTVAVNASGPIQDASSIFYNPFRKKWVFSLKQGFTSEPATLQYRARAYVEVDDLIHGATSWTHMYRGQNGTHPWASADLNDPAWPYNSSLPAQVSLQSIRLRRKFLTPHQT